MLAQWMLVLALGATGDTLPRNGGFEEKAGKDGAPPGWTIELGAQNGATKPESKVELDAKEKHGGKTSLHLSGEAATRGWMILKQPLEVRPGDRYSLEAWTRTAGVKSNGSGINNCYVGLFFFDADEKLVGRKLAVPAQPDSPWTKQTLVLDAAPNAHKGYVYVFLSMIGDLWVDDLALTIEKGVPPYSDWITLAGKGVTLRYSPAHPHAKEMKAKLAELEQSKKATCRALEVEFPEMITVFLYKDLEEGRQLTGADLDFADPKGRKVHQQWDSFIGHEMVHVIAHNTLQYGQTGILGEGLAVWLNGAFKDRHTSARELLEKGELPSVKDLVERFREAKNSYPAAGSFCGFLIETYGLPVFKQLYPLAEPSAKLKELKGKSFEELEPEWLAFLKKH